METIHNYLESMFARLPNTQEVIRAKCELGQMMEDKYSELIEAGKSDNEAVAQVIAEFGNLEELSDALGISHILHGDNVYADNIRQITENEVHSYIYDATFCGLLRGIGIFLAIICSSGPILAATYHASSAKGAMTAGLVFLFCSIAAAVALLTYSALRMGRWSFIRRMPCSIDYSTAGMVNDGLRNSHGSFVLQRTIAVLLFCSCYIPLIVLDYIDDDPVNSGIGVTILLFMVGIAVWILVAAAGREKSYITLLGLNSSQKMDGHYYKEQKKVHYGNRFLDAVMPVYWPTVSCVYLIISFLTFRWDISWIIWPIAAVAYNLIRNL